VLSSCHIAGAFFLQCVTGLVVNLWTGHGGHYPPLAYRAAFALIVILQIAAMIWFAFPAIRSRRSVTIKISLRGKAPGSVIKAFGWILPKPEREGV